MVKALASGRRQSVDPAIIEASGRFAVDCEKDLSVARRRVEDSKRIEAAQQRLAELRSNPPVPPPTRETPLEQFKTLGELAAAIMLINNKAALWGPRVDWDHAVRAEEATIKKAVGYLRSSSDLSIDEKIRAARASIQRVNEATAERANLAERLDDLKRKLDRANPRSERERSEVLAQRAEYSKLKKQAEGLPDVDTEAVEKAEAEIAKLQEQQLLPENMQFTEPSGKRQELFAVPVRFA